ncbi:CDP-alcohol phosphatidyltransferase family protein [Rubrobacter indicoceani]|uniref:CDP-alcohol phosphatidyltransferase family protein n=1 Tax=Rubrobacter indicoceani TaxID=2051957 RepID=UPI001969A152|nr:CDP-alcohol phosphatidyltransferase family protein [Rubrobacter indicoceani]
MRSEEPDRHDRHEDDVRPELREGEDTPPWFRLKAVGVHLYTASGVVLAMLILAAAFQGQVETALWLMLATLVIDSTDGLLARRFRVSEALPFFDGAMLDNIVDYVTYVFAPVALLWSGGFFPAGNLGLVVAAVPLLASSYQFCRVDAKTDDHFFLGFPSYFNVLAFYAIVFEMNPGALAALVIGCSLFVFVPIRYIYPTRTVAFRKLSLLLSALWLVAYAIILLQLPDPHPLILGFSIAYLFYYFGLSLFLHGKMVLDERRMEEGEALD